ncbi:hypothetical protein O181_051610 [Austropuccinia psidii MF-1]|uniref:Class E vacuolar protein-sorting machinery protein HSE1 n=1 Tax=Austropuccinia psidii MF-1 TaxID=1389203 RepID=A0A9Q3E3C7_9BASI|nr:hypothetical protein [Austropuccinia psidii MF-1]
MFRGTPPNPYDDIILKATDEAQTSENWSLFIEICDKVMTDTTPTGPRDCIAAIQKRLQHRNANVQLFCLTLSECLVKNTNENLHKEVSSRSFMKVLSSLVIDRYTHEKVKKRILQCLKSWSDDFHGNANLGLVEETVEDLKAKGHQYEEETSPSTHPPDEILKREEEDLQRALAESEREAEWMNMAGVGNFPKSNLNTQAKVALTGYVPASSQPRYGNNPFATTTPEHPKQTPHSSNNLPGAQYPSGNNHQAPVESLARVSLQDAPVAIDSSSLHPAAGAELHSMRTKSKPAPRRVKALYDFEPNEEGELPFKEGDVIRVIDSAYKDWWKGELRGQIGILPVNYVEPIPDPSPEALVREAEAEAAVFAQAVEIDRLLQMLKNLDAKKDNLAENDELSELYQQTLTLRPKIVRLIEKYTQKKAELLQINSKFMQAKTTYDVMIEESLAKHHPGVAAEAYTQPNPNYQRLNQYGVYAQAGYGYEQVPYPGQPSRTPQPYQQPIGPVTSPGHPQYPPRDGLIPEGIDTSRYYLASDGNWYAYSPEQLAANMAATGVSQVAIPTLAVSAAQLQPHQQPQPQHQPLQQQHQLQQQPHQPLQQQPPQPLQQSHQQQPPQPLQPSHQHQQQVHQPRQQPHQSPVHQSQLASSTQSHHVPLSAPAASAALASELRANIEGAGGFSLPGVNHSHSQHPSHPPLQNSNKSPLPISTALPSQ